MSGHTPGPWTVHDAPNSHVGNFPCVSVLAPSGDDFQVVAFCVARDSAPDARLIAAAPDLFAACKRAIRYIECNEQGRCRGCGRSLGHMDICNAKPMINALRDAINKADGGDK